MSENSPSPTPARAVYGFALFLLSHTLFILYLIYAYIPNSILEDKLGLHYLPDKYFALTIPILSLVGLTLFTFFIYPSVNISMTPKIDQLETITDKYQIFRCQFVSDDGKICENRLKDAHSEPQWITEKYCSYHNELGDCSEINSNVETFCDCPKNIVCLLRENPNHIAELKERSRIPAARDLDIANVYKEIFNM